MASNDLKRIKELASDNVLTSGYLILAECEKLKARLSLELQALRDDRKAQQKEFSEFMVYLRETLDEIRAKHLIDAQLLDLVRKPMPETKKEDKNKPKQKPVGFHLSGTKIFELGFDGTFTYFICHDFKAGGWRKVLEIPITKDLVLVPLNDPMVEKGAVYLPTAPESYGTDRDLYDLVQHFIHQYVAVSDFYQRLSAYYVVFTWVYDRFSTLPYLRALGDYGSGKSRFLKTIGSICYRPMFVGGATTPAPIFRIIDRHQGTLIIDEADFRFSDSTADITKILNCGYEVGLPVIRADKNKNFEPVPFHVYGPKLLATRKNFQDKALESRCLTEEMDLKWRPDIPSILPDTFWDEALEIRNRLLQWRFDKYPHVKLRHDRINESVEPRLNQVLMPLASIIEDQTMLDDLREFAEKYNKRIVTERGMLWEAEVLQAIVDLAQGTDVNKSPNMRNIADQVNEERGDKEDHITPHKVGKIVGDRLRLRKVNKRGRYHLVWDGEKIKKLCERYGVIVDDDFGGLVDFVDSPIERATKSTEDKTEDDDFVTDSIEKSSKSSSQHNPTPESCGDCRHFKIGQGWIGCNMVNQRVRDLEICPITED